jgi:Fic-DOC domain mobile mystery protein B
MSTSKRNILSESFIKALHKKMFGDVWVWAGKFRTTEKNIGIKAYKIQESLKVLLNDVNYWILNNTFSKKEIAHRLVQIHPFPNGNGRTSRLMADLFMQKFGATKLCWGTPNLTEISEARKHYILALREADNGDYQKLLNFITIVSKK